jgi:DNA-binding transcriptional regulator YdaS (Cro superfamily)
LRCRMARCYPCRMSLSDYVSAERGRRAALARVIKVHPVLVSQWASGKRGIPSDRCPAIERGTGGKVTCEEMRPDVVWHRVPDAEWPHPRGRPLIDVAGAASVTRAGRPPSRSMNESEAQDAA